ncbi:MAG: hypothetical protein R3B13_01115 [Polyangiaceae bacterium]
MALGSVPVHQTLLGISVVVTFTATACDTTTKQAVPSAPSPTSAATPKPGPATSTSPNPGPELPTPAAEDPAKMPFDFPAARSIARVGEFVLAPTQSTVEEAIAVGSERQAFIYYGGRLESADDATSVVKLSTGRKSRVANALVLAIGPKTEAKVGDIVITAWASGTGLQRAIVVAEGTPRRPNVRYLDITLNNPSGWGERVDQLPEGTFRVLDKPGVPGTTLACSDKNRTTRQILVGRAEGKVLGLGFAGKLKVFDDKTCTPLPVQPKLEPGDAVRVPVLGTFTAAKITKLDAAIGRVWAKYAHGSEEHEDAIGFTNVWPGSK